MIRHSFSVLMLVAAVAVISTTKPAYSADNPQQQRMKDRNAQAIGMSGDAQQKFMSSCLSGKTAETKTPNCVNGKPCGNSCIAKDKVCRK
jgi:hypothetical protein